MPTTPTNASHALRSILHYVPAPPVSAEVELPLEDTELDNRNYDDEKQQVGGFGTPHGKIHIKQQINHDGEVNRARWANKHTVLATGYYALYQLLVACALVLTL